MDPNNNQQVNTNPLGQAGVPPVVTPTPAPVQPNQPAQPAADQNIPTAPNNTKKILILLIVLIILTIGVVGYYVYAKNFLNTSQQISTYDSSATTPSPTPTAVPPASAEEIDVESPDTDLIEIETDILEL